MSYNTSYLAANEIMGAIKHRAQLAQFYFADIERAVVKATAPDNLVPKEKHVQNILAASMEGNQILSDSLKTLDRRLHDEKSWQIAFKSLIVIHRLLREGESNRVVALLNQQASILNMTSFRDNSSGAKGLEQGSNIKAYAAYLEERTITSFELKIDYTRSDNRSTERINGLTWKAGLEEEVQRLQRQIKSLLDCKFYLDSIDNDITTEALRLLVKDLLRLFQVLNEGVIKILKEFFELGQADAKRALEIYKSFVKQTEQVTDFFEVARKLQYGLGMTIPEIKHAPLALLDSLQQYVNSTDMSSVKNRNNAQASAGKPISDIFAAVSPATAAPTPQQPSLPARQPQPDLFASLASNSSSSLPQRQLAAPAVPQPSSSNFDDLLGLSSSAFNSPPQQQQQQFGNQFNTGSSKLQPSSYQFQQVGSQQSSMVSVGLSTPQMQPRTTAAGNSQPFGGTMTSAPAGFNVFQSQQQPQRPPLSALQSQSSFQSFASGSMPANNSNGFNNYQVVQPQGGSNIFQPQLQQQQQQQPLFGGTIGAAQGQAAMQMQQPAFFQPQIAFPQQQQQQQSPFPQQRPPQPQQQNPFGQQQQMWLTQ